MACRSAIDSEDSGRVSLFSLVASLEMTVGPFNSGEYLHFRCYKHTVDGHFEERSYPSEAKCEVPGCENRGRAYWYRGPQYAQLQLSYPANFQEWLMRGGMC